MIWKCHNIFYLSDVLEDGDWKPKQKGYDFLSFIDQERERFHPGSSSGGRDYLDVANEQGLGVLYNYMYFEGKNILNIEFCRKSFAGFSIVP